MLIDSHHHFWSYNTREFQWIKDTMKVIGKSFLPADLKQELEKNRVDGVVTVQARQSLEETSWLLELADEHDFIKGVVGWVDLRSNEVEDQLEQFAANPKFVGVRHVVQDEPDDRFMLRDDFLRGISLLQKYNLTYDILIFPKHLPVAVEMVKQFPEQKFVLDHIAKPLIKDKKVEPWKTDIERLAEYRNVYCKISGMVTEADWKDWAIGIFRPYMDIVVNAFGFDRLMLGSDWPVCLLAASYKNVLDIPLEYIDKLHHDLQHRIMAGNCVEFYGLDV